jgi:hypothetical protein
MNTKAEAIKELKEYLNKGDTVYTVLRHVSRSGMYRVISLIAIKDNQPVILDGLAANILPEGYDHRHHGCKASGAGMDMGFHLVYELGYALFGDGYALKQKWL